MINYIASHPWIIAILLIWTLPWKAAALWLSARRSQFGWFLAMIVLNTFGILEILYIFFFTKTSSQSIAEAEPKTLPGLKELREREYAPKKIIM